MLDNDENDNDENDSNSSSLVHLDTETDRKSVLFLIAWI